MPDNFGFYQPITMSMTAPDGPPEYQEGWRAGCRSGVGIGVFTSGEVYRKDSGPDFSSPKYQADPKFQAGWSHGWFSCVTHAGNFVNLHSMKFHPLQ